MGWIYNNNNKLLSKYNSPISPQFEIFAVNQLKLYYDTKGGNAFLACNHCKIIYRIRFSVTSAISFTIFNFIQFHITIKKCRKYIHTINT